jgi:hypothetical protein
VTVSKSDRDELVGWLKANLIGPIDGDEEVLKQPPSGHYQCGILFPSPGTEASSTPSSFRESPEPGSEVTDDDDFGVDEPDDGAPKEDIEAQPLRRRSSFPPSSVGMSIFVTRDAVLVVSASAAFYESDRRRSSGPDSGGRSSCVHRKTRRCPSPRSAFGMNEPGSRPTGGG